jgi:hypothetical protein
LKYFRFTLRSDGLKNKSTPVAMCQLLCLHCLPNTLFAWSLLSTQVIAQTIGILQTLSSFTELSTLNFHINASQTISNILSTSDNITFIAPSNTAFDGFLESLSPMTPSEADIEALLTYHLLSGSWPAAAFTTQPQFVPTFLNDPAHANVTDGQVVELLEDANGKSTFISGNKTISPIIKQVGSCSRVSNFHASNRVLGHSF